MSTARWEQIKKVFNAAMEKPAGERAAFLEHACAGDAELRSEVESLILSARPTLESGLVQTGGAVHAMASATTTAFASLPLTERAGTLIGPYKLLQIIGEGGFGTVFLADQASPIRRRVALKIIKLGMDTRSVVARFEAERQALALMDHPNIAKVFDGGATDSGRPYFVMEYVKGDPITIFADAHTLTLRERLELLTQVCLAVQHAHQKGIIHRDIKPSNVLVSMVDGRPLAKVIDFGIAKATGAAGGTLTDKTLFTEHRALIGTPEYMSPEQAEGSPDIDTRTDVYGLGVLMYELLTGTTPFEPSRLRSAAYAEMQRIIREEEPPSPSLRITRDVQRDVKKLASTAAQRKVEPQKLNALMRGELDWIVMRALEKDRARRFATPQDLAADIDRHLRGEAVVAAPASAAYRVRKFVKRNKGAVLAFGTIAAVVMVAGITVIGFAQRAVRESLRAEQQAGLVVDAAAFTDCATFRRGDQTVTFWRTVTPAAVRHLASLQEVTIVQLRFDWRDSGDETLRLLATKNIGLNNLITLDLSDTGVTAEGLKALADKDTGLKKLTTLTLYGTAADADGLKILTDKDTGLKNLTTLILSDGTVTAEGLKALAAKDTGLKNLTTLTLKNKSITAEGLKALAAEGSGLKNLTTLDLSYTNVTDEGLKALADKDTALKNLTTLDLQSNSVTDEGLKALADKDTGLKNLTTLNLDRTSVTDDGLKALADKDTALKNLTTLSISSDTVTANGLKALAAKDTGLKNLTTLDLSGDSVTDEGLKALADKETGLKNLTTLNLYNNKVTDEGLKALAAKDTGLKNLTTLYLSGDSVTDEGLKALAAKDTGLKNLTSLGLDETKVTDEGVAAVKARFPGIKIER